MAGRRITFVTTTEVALGAASLTTILRVSASSSVGVLIKEWGVYFDGTSAIAEPTIVRLVRLSSDGTMTGLAGNLEGMIQGEDIQASGAHTATVEPSVASTIEVKEVHPQSGYEKVSGLAEEHYIPPSGRVGIQVTSPATVNVIPYMKIEE